MNSTLLCELSDSAGSAIIVASRSALETRDRSLRAGTKMIQVSVNLRQYFVPAKGTQRLESM